MHTIHPSLMPWAKLTFVKLSKMIHWHIHCQFIFLHDVVFVNFLSTEQLSPYVMNSDSCQ